MTALAFAAFMVACVVAAAVGAVVLGRWAVRSRRARGPRDLAAMAAAVACVGLLAFVVLVSPYAVQLVQVAVREASI